MSVVPFIDFEGKERYNTKYASKGFIFKVDRNLVYITLLMLVLHLTNMYPVPAIETITLIEVHMSQIITKVSVKYFISIHFFVKACTLK